MRTIDDQTPFTAVLANPAAVAAIEDLAPEVLRSPMTQNLADAPTGPLVQLILGESDPRTGQVLARLAAFEDTSPRGIHETPLLPRPDYEDQRVERASARLHRPVDAERHRRVEVRVDGPSHGNPFVDVTLSATFTHGDRSVTVGGCYDGEGRYLIRFLPEVEGTWHLVTASNARSLDGLTLSFPVAAGDAHGPVRVVDRFHFAHADGTPFLPVGTTAYAWTHQTAALQEQTVETLDRSPFTKIRMCLFPKDYLYNTEEPERFVFPRDPEGGWDTTRFDVEYFAQLEHRLEQLEEIGVQADLILFHPYDRWGFAHLSDAADDRYVSYVVRRLAAYPHVWWSMANEYDLLAKRREDWDRLAALVRREDHVGHPLSIHNWVQIFDYDAEWATHASLQRGDYRIGEKIDQWRARWGKPVLIDEFGYEGDLDQGWGNLLAEEVVRRFWEGTLRGGYLTHGETYWDEDDLIWWSKGGTLHGESPARLAFLREVVAASPTGRIDPLTSSFDDIRGGVDGQYVLIYFGASRPRFRDVVVPDGMTARIEVIDTWAMTVRELDGTRSGSVRVQLPAAPYIAIRLSAVGTGELAG
jgi:hypothetical protein